MSDPTELSSGGSCMTQHRLPRSLVAVVLMAAAVATSPVHLSSATVTPPGLAGTTTLSGSRPGYVDVVLPRAATIATPFGPSSGVTVHGGGRIVGAVLRGTSRTTLGLAVFAGRVLGRDGDQGYATPLGNYPYTSGGTYHFVKTSDAATVLPAGSYRLFLVTDGHPATVTLHLRGITGQRTLRPLVLAHATVSSMPDQPTTLPTAHGNLVAAGDRRTLNRPGLALQAVRLDTTAYAAGTYVFCHRNGPDDLPGDSYLPSCLLRGDSVLANDRDAETATGTQMFINGWSGVPAGPQSLGFTYVSESVIKNAATAGLWLEY